MPEAESGVGVGDDLDVRVLWIGVSVVGEEAEEDEAASGEEGAGD